MERTAKAVARLEELSFLDGDVFQLKFQITDIGSHVAAKNSWKRAWTNKHLPELSRKKSEKLKELSQKTGSCIFSRLGVSQQLLTKSSKIIIFPNLSRFVDRPLSHE